MAFDSNGVNGAWKDDYNDHRPLSSLGNLTPSEFASNLALEKQAA